MVNEPLKIPAGLIIVVGKLFFSTSDVWITFNNRAYNNDDSGGQRLHHSPSPFVHFA